MKKIKIENLLSIISLILGTSVITLLIVEAYGKMVEPKIVTTLLLMWLTFNTVIITFFRKNKR